METTNKLPEDFKQKWVAALRSGEYKQCEDVLHSVVDNSYCCLGVACTVTGYHKNELLGHRIIEHDTFPNVPNILTGSCEDNPLIDELTSMNDGRGRDKKSFSEIADYIEANL